MSAALEEALGVLARNHRWTWHHPTRRLLEALPGSAPDRHPVATLATLATVPSEVLEQWTTTHAGEIAGLYAELTTIRDAVGPPQVAYFSPEFGIASQLPQYSGGLGILAGDHLKAASDLALPLVGIGLLYRQGFFRQEIAGGGQVERYETVDPDTSGAVDTGVIVTVPVAGADVAARVWRQEIGATPLLLLDTDVESNSVEARSITDRLYSGDRRHRLHQELILGVGGVRALRALGLAPTVYHLNEGHACFLLLELLAEHVDAGSTLAEARAAVRAATLFTTHTPVPAGIDRFDRDLVRGELAPWARRLGIDLQVLLGWATMREDGDTKPFNTAALALELCGQANGVSQLHATVSRQLFASIPRAAAITGITNGVHARTWVTPDLQQIYDEVLGSGWDNGAPEAWARVGAITDAMFASIRTVARGELLDIVAVTTGAQLDPQGCVIGFARRFATYKRAGLLLRDPAGLARALDNGAQFVFAGKAHPADGEGKALLAEIVAFAESRHAGGRVVLVPDYDITIAQALYAGSDVWLNNPIRPREACGTSGEKAALNGVLNCSILDGWWADWYADGIGWAIPNSSATDPEERDDTEAASLLRIVNDEVLPRFFDQSGAWWDTVRRMLEHLGPLVTAGRMVAEYDHRFYLPMGRR